MEAINIYINLIKVLEDETKRTRLKVSKKGISFTREVDKKYLNKLEDLLFFYYKEFEKFSKKEIEFQENLNKEMIKVNSNQ